MSVNLSPLGGAGAQFFTNDGVPLTGGLLYTYLAGTSTPATTYTSSSGITALANPIILDAAGRVPTGEIWLTDGISYKFVLKDSTDVLIATWDGLSGINSNFIAYTSLEETATATAGQTVFNLTIDYIAGANSLAVFVNGSNQIVNVNYLETDTNTVTFLTGLNVGDVVKFSTATPVATNAVDAANVSYTPAGVGAVTTTVQAKLRQYVSVKDFGAVGDGVTDDYDAILAAISINSGSNLSVFFPAGTYAIRQKLTLIGNNIKLYGEAGKASRIIPHSSYVAPASPDYLFSTKVSWSFDFNFFIEISDLTFGADKVTNLGAINFAAGGGSSITNSYIYDGGAGAITCKIYAVAATFTSVYVGTSDAIPVHSVGMQVSGNGLTFNGCTVDYCSNVLGMYAILFNACTSAVFNGMSLEGNKCPIYSSNSGGVTFVAAEIYRLGKGSTPSTDPDIVVVADTNINNCPTFINSLVWYGYNYADGGGILKIGVTIFDILKNSIGYFNLNAVSPSTIFQNVDFRGYSSLNMKLVAPSIDSSFLTTSAMSYGSNVVKVLDVTPIAAGASGSFDVLFKSAGLVLITATRADSQLYGQTILGIFSGSFDAATFTEISRNSVGASYNYISTVVARTSNSGLTITWDASTKPAGNISVTLIGATV